MQFARVGFVLCVARRRLQVTVDGARAPIEQLPTESREVLVLREIEGLSYKEIATVVRVPIGTVMSRLSRARDRLQNTLTPADPMETLQ